MIACLPVNHSVRREWWMAARCKEPFRPSEHHAICPDSPPQLNASVAAKLPIKIAPVQGLQVRLAAKTMLQTRCDLCTQTSCRFIKVPYERQQQNSR